MRKLFYLLFFTNIFFGNTFAQDFIVVDSVSQKPISYVDIQLDKKKGIYSNAFGRFDLSKNIEVDSLKFSHIGYHDYVVATEALKDSIFLVPKTNRLTEVRIIKPKNIKKIDFLKTTKKFGSKHLNPKQEILVHI
ncbi:peptidase associated/transthyretin-like domain-containing protein [Haloflavibacter putidus]|uniref:Carboxypeptidase-like regulatory domain-containing protein n=1 Tax=Haloflavibacter putidus TaxID=2576776 RepID=A0A507ZRZ8_9FLAO|nr:carboxypeptidase-like regulatory domain-containing protein [Haloflavibacter putidus]TQD39283.1 carboxypeptidase-like regulatory domain-containing protein [Haloflavibacter putidus]